MESGDLVVFLRGDQHTMRSHVAAITTPLTSIFSPGTATPGETAARGVAIDIAREVAQALDYAHRHDIVHRDIKPENILRQDGHAVVADLGIASAIAGAAGGLTPTGLVVGTPAYMSAEQASGHPADGRSDQYSLGCVLYEMLAGVPLLLTRPPACARSG